jgi:hypothetical protein
MSKSIKRAKPKPTRQNPSGKGKTPAARQSTPQKNAAKKANTAAPVKGKLGSVIALLRRPKGASIAELCKATDWQAHSVRGALSGSIKKKLGLKVTSEKSDGVRTYRIVT